MGVPVTGERSYVVNVNVGIVYATQYILHCCLSKVRGALESHWESCIFVHAKWCAYCAEVLTLVIELKGVILHTDVELGEKLVSNAFTKDVSNDR